MTAIVRRSIDNDRRKPASKDSMVGELLDWPHDDALKPSARLSCSLASKPALSARRLSSRIASGWRGSPDTPWPANPALHLTGGAQSAFRDVALSAPHQQVSFTFGGKNMFSDWR